MPFFSSGVFAQTFSTDYQVTYNVSQNAKTTVEFNIALTNESDQYYASSYTIQVGFKDIENVRASDSQGSITPKVSKSAKGNNIELSFNDKITGFGNKLNFKLSFDTLEIAQNVGSVWEVNIPGLSKQSDFSSFNVTVLYPSYLGRPTFIKPNIPLLENTSGRLSFGKSDLGGGGISIAFGDFQIYKFDLAYHLGNKNLFPVKTEIALPPTTNYQDVLINKIDPMPSNVRIDRDGNWLAEYKLLPSQNIDVTVAGVSKVYISPREDPYPEEKLKEYLKDKPYWQVSDSKVKSEASRLKTPRAIYQYVVDTLAYDFSRVTQNKPRAGALNILNDPSSAVCLEFTDLFVTLARASGIPAREVDGFANTKNSQERPLSLVADVLHAWPQFYDREKKTWIMVDPTWGNTTSGIDYFDVLDFDHFAFVIKGTDSDYPIPAGGYKLFRNLSDKDVNVSFTDTFDQAEKLGLEIILPDQVFPGTNIKGTLRVKNSGNGLSDRSEIEMITDYAKPNRRKIIIQSIPPFGFIDIPVEFDAPFLTNKTDEIKITLGKEEFKKRILISPFFVNIYSTGGVLIAISLIVLSIYIGRSRGLHLRR